MSAVAFTTVRRPARVAPTPPINGPRARPALTDVSAAARAPGWPSFGSVPLLPPGGLARPAVSLPVEGAEEEQITDAPLAIVDEPPRSGGATSGRSGAGEAAAGAEAVSSDICAAPVSMTKRISGTFAGGLSLDDYYPDLVGKGYWDSANTAGPFDTGTRVGSSVQLAGAIRIPCRPDLYSLAQTVTYTRLRVGGTADPNEGKTFDDIAKSGRDATKAPFRQEFMNLDGYWISMADPPSVVYGSTTDVEFDRDFVTSLVGPSGRQSVNWSTSIRIAGGKVTRNSVT
jgi:hypothetical protein